MIIGFVGFARAGKSTAAAHMEKNYKMSRVNFKDCLVSELKQNFPDLLNELSEQYKMSIDELFNQKPPAMRALMRNYGTEVRRGDDDLYWVEQWHKSVQGKTSVVVDDVRFLNEAQEVKDVGGIIIRIMRPDITTGGDHKSETEQLAIEADYTIEAIPNDHEALYRQLDEIMAE